MSINDRSREERYCLFAAIPERRFARSSKDEISSDTRAGSSFPPALRAPPGVNATGAGVEKCRYDIAARKGRARCRKILKLKILKARARGDIRVRDIGGRQLSCSWRLLRGHELEKERKRRRTEGAEGDGRRVNVRVGGGKSGGRRTEARKTK